MTQRTDTPTTASYSGLRSLLLKSMSCISILSLFSSNLVLAQTEVAIDLQPLNPPVAPKNNVPSTSPAKWQRLRQKLVSAPVKRQINSVVIPAAPTKFRRIRPSSKAYTPSAPHITATKARSGVERQNNLSNSLNSVKFANTQVRSRLERQNNLPNSLNSVKLANTATDFNGAYIDPTAYKLGATTGYEAPKAVVLSERATGCKAVVRSGLSGSICRPATRHQTRIARLVQPRVGSFSSRTVTRTGVRPISVGPISINASGFRVTTNPQTQRSVLTYSYRNAQPYTQSSGINSEFMFPLTIPAPITSLFGWRIHPISGDRRFHAGTDIGAPLGTPVLAAHSGNVEIADYLGGYGLTVVLNHNKFTQQTLYAHLSEIFVEPGESIEQGTVIGRVGSTGNSTGPHLHFETRQLTPEGWVVIDPGVQLETAMTQLLKALQPKGTRGEG